MSATALRSSSAPETMVTLSTLGPLTMEITASAERDGAVRSYHLQIISADGNTRKRFEAGPCRREFLVSVGVRDPAKRHHADRSGLPGLSHFFIELYKMLSLRGIQRELPCGLEVLSSLWEFIGLKVYPAERVPESG